MTGAVGDCAQGGERGPEKLSQSSLAEPGRLLGVDAAESNFNMMVMEKPGTNERKGERPFVCKGIGQWFSPGDILHHQGTFGNVLKYLWLSELGGCVIGI